MWMSYMEKVLKDVPEAEYAMPDGMVAARINENGQRDPNGNRVEYFYQENLPPAAGEPQSGENAEHIDSVKDQLF
jgi:penicillin-binding protein 1A